VLAGVKGDKRLDDFIGKPGIALRITAHAGALIAELTVCFGLYDPIDAEGEIFMTVIAGFYGHGALRSDRIVTGGMAVTGRWSPGDAGVSNVTGRVALLWLVIKQLY
jgi:hypothetical protein